MWDICSSVCSGNKSGTSEAISTSGTPVAGQNGRSRLTVNYAQASKVAQEDTAVFANTEAAEAEGLPSEVTSEGADLPQAAPFPSPGNLVKDCLEPSSIFRTAPHEFCLFGNSNKNLRMNGNRAEIEPEYQEKELTISGATDSAALSEALLKLGIAIRCKKGKKPEQPNQDNVLFCKMGSFSICGVVDGHGPDGHWASHWAARFMMKLLMLEVSAANNVPGDEALTRMFEVAQQALQLKSASDRFDLNMSGSTLSICVIDHRTKLAVAAWVGDSRCAIGRPGGVKGQSWTIDHKPENTQEKMRIKASGGEVVRLEHDVPHRVFVRGGEIPGLAMSRAMGDMIAHSVGVIHVPGIVRVKLEEDMFVLCCSDGVWEFIESDEAAEMVSKVGRNKVGVATERLAKESHKRWINEEQYITDDISAICIWL